jgi:diguanylate cyclase (GGDEF)-like protein/PAS domain S-box-containing protein
MFRVLTCLAYEHDWRLVVLAGAVCLLSSIVVVSLFHRALATANRTRTIWLALAATVGGCGIWATHFIAMLAYDPGVVVGYNVALTGLSLMLAAAIMGAGLAMAMRDAPRWLVPAGGAVAGIGIAAMHYTGMSALELQGRIVWSGDLVSASVALGMLFGGISFVIVRRRIDVPGSLLASAVLTLAIVSHHFTAMGAVTVVPDPTRAVDALLLSPGALAFVIAGAAVAILGMAFVAAFADRKSDDKLRIQKVQLDTALENMSQGLCMFDAQGRIALFNDRYARMMGYSREFLTGRSLLDLFKHRKAQGEFAGDPEEFFARVIADARAGKSATRVLETPNGAVLRVVDEPMAGGGWVATFEDITEMRKAEAQITYLARHDALTGLPNRTLFRERMEQALRRVSRGEQLAVLCLDLDHFKDVNDSLGHPIGDELLEAVARRLNDCVREIDTVARLGGDEFAILQVGGHGQPGEATALASRIVEVVGKPYDLKGHQVVVGTSVGVSIAPADGADPDQLLKNADMALYRAKSDGRGTYRFFEAAMDAQAQARRALELDLRAALMKGEFELYYQPIHDLGSNRIISFEALVRWNHPLRGMVAPMSFIPVAEETGLIVPIGEWVLRQACSEAARWSQDVRVAVNLSPVQFKSRNLVPTVIAALSASGLPPSRLELEITESVLLQDNEATLQTLHTLRDLGVRISMDDFGTGYSSLSYLRSFPFDKIKIDQSFIGDLGKREDSMAIVRAVTSLGKSLGIATTAEGVETSDQLSLLRTEGCTEVQGYLFSAPRPAAEVEKLLSRSDDKRAVA